jgi:putative phosphoribosyl transferase
VRFQDRRDAGFLLARELARELQVAELSPVVVALPRGGVPVAAQVARLLDLPLEILAVRKLGAPANRELAVGAIAEDGTVVLDPRTAVSVGMTRDLLDETVAREVEELHRRVERYRRGRVRTPLAGRAVIVVDDGFATGLSDLAAVRALRKANAGPVIVSAPVASSDAIAMLEDEADRVVCVITPRTLFGVGAWYEDFAPVTDDEVLALLRKARAPEATGSDCADGPGDHPEDAPA